MPTEKDKERFKAIEYVVKTKEGYREDLIDAIGQDYVNEFETLGYISSGYTWERKTWGCLNLARKEYDILKEYFI